MKIKWSKTAVDNLISAIEYLEEKGYYKYAIKLESEILNAVFELPKTYLLYELDRFKLNNDNTFKAFVVDKYRISFRVNSSEIQILRIRHTSRKPK
jgi:plasmid stabilization system protein ParE